LDEQASISGDSNARLNRVVHALREVDSGVREFGDRVTALERQVKRQSKVGDQVNAIERRVKQLRDHVARVERQAKRR
jgi:IS1 family transposase